VTYVDTHRMLYAAFGRGDLATIIAHCSEDVVWGEDVLPANIPVGGIRHGREGVAEYFRDVQANLEILHFDPHTIVAEGNQVVAFIHTKTRIRKNDQVVGSTLIHHATYNDQGQLHVMRVFSTNTAAFLAAWNTPALVASK
jgi:ketosteroid isomerase-like protein